MLYSLDMSPLITCYDITKSFGSKELFSKISLSIFFGDRVGVIGPNGSGKSTLLKIIADIEKEDEGSVTKKRNLIVGYVPQVSQMGALSVFDTLMEAEPNELEAKTWISKLDFKNPDQIANTLSGGWQKKLDLARALMKRPDVLLLDEPTNHLDLDSILWLENFLIKEVPTFLVTSHDRKFLENVAGKMMELNRAFPKGLFAAPGNFNDFVAQKEVFLEGQIEYQKSLATKVRREEAWLRTTPQARTTKSKSRIDRAGELIQELSTVKQRTKTNKLGIDFSSTERETKKLLSTKNIGKTLGGNPLFSKMDILLSPGTRLGLLGPNGSGKSTLLKILAGELAPDTGTIKIADGLKIVYFDQMRAQLPLHLTIKEALAPYGEYVTFQGKEIHVNSWGKKFFFPPNLMELPLSQLSGGERARLLIARLMLQPADILLLDEPTNDLDIDTLEVMEESLETFHGAVVLITHDREMMKRVTRETLTLTPEPLVEQDKVIKTPLSQKRELKVSFKEKFEYEELAKEIALLEKEVAKLTEELSHPDAAMDHQKLDTLGRKLHLKEERLHVAFERWCELDNKIRVN